MAKSTGPPRIVPLGGTYQDYLSRSNTNTFCGRYAAILMPYAIDPAASAADSVPDDVVRLIHAAMQEGVPTAFLKWHQGMRGGSTQIEIFHLVLSYVPRMGLPEFLWDNLYFASKREATYSAAACAN